MVDCATPVFVGGNHIADIFTGQLFFEEPDRAFFEEQAARYGYDRNEYLQALEDTPVVSKERVIAVMEFLSRLAMMTGEKALKIEELHLLTESLSKTRTASMSLLEDLILARNVAEKASRAKSDFLASMSHEIRTPLNAVIGMADLAMMTNSDEEKNRYLEIVRSSGHHLLHVINDILDISKMEAGKIELEEVDFSLPRLLDDLEMIFNKSAEEKNISFTISHDETVPEYLTADPVRLRQILINLISNAIKFTDAGEVTLSVSGRPSSKPEQVELVFMVCDTGCGIAEENQDEIFTAFSQADASITRLHGGTGLGLYIVQRLVWLMNGTIELKSEMGKGSEFTVTLPLKISLHRNIQDFHGRDEKRTVAALRVLLAEDNDVNALLATTVLKKLGHSVVRANNGHEVLAALSDVSFDLVFMDIEMPGMDGLEATRRIREGECGDAAAAIPIIAMTAHAVRDIKDEGLKAGMNLYLTKPFNVTDLQKNIDRLFFEDKSSS